ncbi:hypothetical protein JFU49_04085 [Pseudomonas sp. TH03]|jgi:hypothetical protein|uniref:hypothetical protein n=1 Tax=Pseudomonas sp. TH03 TaxID=2796369 RepID=UPI00191435CC|nr:hypothetical protein [Pseudomonas sp. TH03]MBK5549467.1 hypothetical protein [Pseudomonas sp. TH03]
MKQSLSPKPRRTRAVAMRAKNDAFQALKVFVEGIDSKGKFGIKQPKTTNNKVIVHTNKNRLMHIQCTSLLIITAMFIA